MFVDASVIVAVLTVEADAEALSGENRTLCRLVHVPHRAFRDGGVDDA
jgi:hypothetical protein